MDALEKRLMAHYEELGKQAETKAKLAQNLENSREQVAEERYAIAVVLKIHGLLNEDDGD